MRGTKASNNKPRKDNTMNPTIHLSGTHNTGNEMRDAVRRFEDAMDRRNLRIKEIKDTIVLVLQTSDGELAKGALYDETLANLSEDRTRPMERRHFDALLSELVEGGAVARRMVGKHVAKYSA